MRVSRNCCCLSRGVVAAIFCVTALSGYPAKAQEPHVTLHLVGNVAPAFAITSIGGKQVSLADYKGNALLVNFWATWCGNCKVEMPWLAELREKYAGQGFEVLGVVTDNAPVEKISALVQKFGVHYPILICNHATAQAFGGLPDLPESFFIDRHGKIVAIMDGADSEREIEVNILKTLHQ